MKVPFIDLVTSVAVNDNEVIDIASGVCEMMVNYRNYLKIKNTNI